MKALMEIKRFVFLALVPTIFAALFNGLLWVAPYVTKKEAFASACEISQMNGYQCQEYKAVTEDGYILLMHRISKMAVQENKTMTQPSLFKELTEESAVSKPVALVLHGLDCESTVFMTNTPKHSLAFLLADAGIDVWLGNTRGTRYSSNHKYLSIQSSEFWNFSWQEQALYDLPAMVDRALSETNQKQLFYIAHSQGTLMGLTKMAFDFNFQSKIKKSYLMAPFVTLQNIQSRIRTVLELFHAEYLLTGDENNQNFQPFFHYSVNRLSALACREPLVPICNFFYFQIGGYTNPENLDSSRLHLHFSHAMSGTSLKNIRHFAQMHLGKKPRLFDHVNSIINLKQYGSVEPSEVNVSNIHTPVALFTGQNDWLVSSLDTQYLIDRLPNVFLTRNCSDFSHLDFMWGMHAADCAYNSIAQDIVSTE